jgi:tetratricopeptide (TPR) repeat protein
VATPARAAPAEEAASEAVDEASPGGEDEHEVGVEDPQPAADPRDEAREQASQLFREGSEDYTLGKYGSAIDKFEEAYRLSNEPEMLYNLGQAYWKKHEVEPSIDSLRQARVLFKNYQKFLGNRGEHSAEVEDFIVELEKQIGDLGEPVEQEGAADPSATLPPPAEDDRKSPALGGMGFTGIAMAVVGVVGGGSMVGVGLASRSRLSDQRQDELDHPNYDDARASQYDTNIGKAEMMTYVSAGVGGALLVAGVVLIAVDAAMRKKKREATAWQPGLAPGGLTLRF